MTDAEIDALSLDAIREQVAVRVMGWHQQEVKDENFSMMAWHEAEGDGYMTFPVDREYHWSGTVIEPFHPECDIRAAWAMEEEIARRGFHREYGNILFKSLRDVGGDGVAFRVAHATPEQRCRAALKAVERMGVQSSA